MGSQGKRYQEASAGIDPLRAYALNEAIEMLQGLPKPKFDESVEIAINLGVDPKHADRMVRGAIVLPHGTGKQVRVLVFAKGDKESEAVEAGADTVGAEDLAKKIQEEGWLEFDRVIATPDMMGVVGRLGRILGPRGLMPNPKLGTVTADVVIDAVVKAKPAAAKGTYLKRIAVSSTMGPGIRVDPSSVAKAA
jgi:large subunit ribosomal protein L1